MNKILANGEYEKSTTSDLQPLVARSDQRVDPKSEPGDRATKARGADPREAAAQDGSRTAPQPAATARLTETDLRALQRTLLTGDAALARRSDLGELNTRIVRMFETLKKGVGEMYVSKAEADRLMLSERIDTLEDAVNRMEGALRIELEPVLREAVAQVMAEQVASRPRRGRFLWTGLVLLAGLALGAFFQDQLVGLMAQIESLISIGASRFLENS
ncbi:MAG: hypothetical protein AAFM92_12815 [Pseudomonadota bacterium]